VPWAALPVGDAGWLVDARRLQFVTSGRDLIARKGVTPGPPTASAAVVFADPDFDAAGAAAAPLDPESVPVTRGHSLAERFARFERLPGTAAEAAAIAPTLETWSGAKAHVFTGSSATVAAFRQVKRPRALVAATHAFLLPGPRDAARTSAVAGPEANPLLRSGLALAGANRRGPEEADGLLTGYHVLSIDLRGTELVVLSACDTGLGDLTLGEGVAGLRQAFQLAGAKSVLASLWQVPDRDTAALMGDFFANLAGGKSKAEALQSAQLRRIAERRKANGGAHPFFWAAFTLAGGE
jgi:CHAT domain-containing protein